MFGSNHIAQNQWRGSRRCTGPGSTPAAETASERSGSESTSDKSSMSQAVATFVRACSYPQSRLCVEAYLQTSQVSTLGSEWNSITQSRASQK